MSLKTEINSWWQHHQSNESSLRYTCKPSFVDMASNGSKNSEIAEAVVTWYVTQFKSENRLSAKPKFVDIAEGMLA